MLNQSLSRTALSDYVAFICVAAGFGSWATAARCGVISTDNLRAYAKPPVVGLRPEDDKGDNKKEKIRDSLIFRASAKRSKLIRSKNAEVSVGSLSLE